MAGWTSSVGSDVGVSWPIGARYSRTYRSRCFGMCGHLEIVADAVGEGLGRVGVAADDEDALRPAVRRGPGASSSC
jgi:hypothetical protein